MKRKHRKTRPAAETARPNRRYKDTVFRMPMQVMEGQQRATYGWIL